MFIAVINVVYHVTHISCTYPVYIVIFYILIYYRIAATPEMGSQPEAGPSTSTPRGIPIPKGKGKGKGKVRRKRTISHTSEDSVMDSAFTKLIESQKQTRDIMENVLKDPPAATPSPLRVEDHLFLACAERMKKMSPETSSFLQLQVAQIFFNAENKTRQVPITPLPVTITGVRQPRTPRAPRTPRTPRTPRPQRHRPRQFPEMDTDDDTMDDLMREPFGVVAGTPGTAAEGLHFTNL